MPAGKHKSRQRYRKVFVKIPSGTTKTQYKLKKPIMKRIIVTIFALEKFIIP